MLKSQRVYGISEIDVSILELFKDLPIAVVSFLIASFLPRIGYKKAMLIALGTVSLACIGMYFGNSFLSAKLLFAAVGASFALIKVSVYSVIGLVTNGEKEHNSLMSNIEGVFMFGVALGYFLFPAFNSPDNPSAWLNVYWLLAGLSILSFLFLSRTEFTEDEEIPGANLKEDFLAMLKLLAQVLVAVFVFSAFLFVMIEQGIMTWLPTFNFVVLELPENLAIMMSSIFVITLGIGRLLAGFITKYLSWVAVITVCLIAALAIFIFVLPKTVAVNVPEVQHFSDFSLIAFAFTLVVLFIAPIFPLLSSVILSALPKILHSPMSGLIIIFSALGGTLGSRIVGYLFDEVGAGSAFFYLLIPFGVLFVMIFVLRRLTEQVKTRTKEDNNT